MTARPPAREALRRLYAGELPLDDVLTALAWHPNWLVLADAGRLVGIDMSGSVACLAFTDREAVDQFLAAGGSRLQTDAGPVADSLETWPHGFYIFWDIADTADCIVINPLSPTGSLSVERDQFPRARRIARDALLSDVLRVGASDPRFRIVLSQHDEYRVIVGDPFVALKRPDGGRAALVFTSRAAADRFLAAEMPSQQAMVVTLDGETLFPQLREHGYGVLFDPGSEGSIGFDAKLPGFVLGAAPA